MTQRERGAINTVWFILVIVLFLGAVFTVYAQQQDIAKQRQAVTEANEKEERANALHQKSTQELMALSTLVGFKPENATKSTPATIQAKIAELKERYKEDIGESDVSLELVLERMKTIAERFERVAQEADANRATELAARQASESARDASVKAVQDQLDQANRDLTDSRGQFTQAQTQAEERAADLQKQIGDAQGQLREAESAAENTVKAAKAEVATATGRITELADKLKIQGSDDNPWAVDGKVVSVGTKTGLAFLDITSRELLRAGVKFDVFRYAKGGEMVRKGSIEVREVATDHSVAGIISVVDPLDPISAGDVVANPHFARNHSKVFVLLGNFPAYGREFLSERLRHLGCTVEDSVSTHTDFLILGEKGTEEGAPELSDDPGFKLAKDLGVQVMKLADIERFIRP